MSRPDPERVEEIFLAALEQPRAQREAWLEAACKDDEALLNEVRSLLDHTSQADDPLEVGVNPVLEAFAQSTNDQAKGTSEVVCPNCQRSLNDPEETKSLPGAAQDVAQDTVVAHAKTGDLIGNRFSILRAHAMGGLGEVSVARDVELNREVALKEIQSQYARDASSRHRFVLEAEITGNLEHPGIVPVYALGKHKDGRPFYAMRFIRGESLQEALERYHQKPANGDAQRENLELRRLLSHFVDVCNAVA